jgi:hypothetical protein
MLYAQLLGLTMGFEDDVLGINRNNMDISHMKTFLSEE